MAFDDTTMAALDGWIGVDTFHTNHAFDEQRFYNFIWAVWQQYGGLWNEEEARHTMIERGLHFHPGNTQLVEDEARDAQLQGTRFLDFLSYLRKEGHIS